ncbi:DNA helicase II / ATP-dependent DNA helicase PcrA, partial [Candidatus Hakubella thermalkaliphila]
MGLLDDLNPSQKEAVLHEGGPLLILAGAGSGKTRVLTYRIAYLIDERGVSPYDILAITFTNKAAGEMKERVRQLVGEVARDMWVSTFHSACVRILRREIGRLGMDRSFAIYDEDDQLRLIIDCLKTLNLDIKRHSPRAIHAAISSAKCELVDAESFARRVMNYFEKVTAEVYQIYQNGLYKANALDFDDLIMTAVTIFQLFPSVSEKYQEKFKHLLVDEYQDTNRAQYELVRLLSQKHRNLCVVGDDDQSIYSWRGADLRNILEFEEEFPEARTIKLERNYRSTRMILDTANSVIRNNRGRKEKVLWTDRGQGDPIFWFKADNEHEEALFAAREIRRLMGEEVRFRYRDFAIFYRTNAQSRVF